MDEGRVQREAVQTNNKRKSSLWCKTLARASSLIWNIWHDTRFPTLVFFSLSNSWIVKHLLKRTILYCFFFFCKPSSYFQRCDCSSYQKVISWDFKKLQHRWGEEKWQWFINICKLMIGQILTNPKLLKLILKRKKKEGKLLNDCPKMSNPSQFTSCLTEWNHFWSPCRNGAILFCFLNFGD